MILISSADREQELELEISEPTESTAVNLCCFQGSESSHGPSQVSHLTSHIPLHISRSLLSPPAVWAVLRAAIPNGNLAEQGLSVANPDLCDPPCSAGVIGTKPAQHRGSSAALETKVTLVSTKG